MSTEKNILGMLREVGFMESIIQHDGNEWSLFERTDDDFYIAIAHDGNFTYAASFNGVPVSYHCNCGSNEIWKGFNYNIEKHEYDFSNSMYSDILYELASLPHYCHCWCP